MKKRVLVHPRKVKWIMEDFINQIHNLTYECLPPADHEETLEEFFDKFYNSNSWVEEKAECKLVKTKKGFGAFINDKGTHTFRIGYNIDELFSKGSKQFANNFYKQCPGGRGFASVTLALLHELGHFYTCDFDFGEYNREEEIAWIESLPRDMTNLFYFLLPDEEAATNWAIEWLSNKENRKIAKAFEKQFFACFE